MPVQLTEFGTFVLKLDAGFIAWTFPIALDTPVAERPRLVALQLVLDRV